MTKVRDPIFATTGVESAIPDTVNFWDFAPRSGMSSYQPEKSGPLFCESRVTFAAVALSVRTAFAPTFANSQLNKRNEAVPKRSAPDW